MTVRTRSSKTVTSYELTKRPSLLKIKATIDDIAILSTYCVSIYTGKNRSNFIPLRKCWKTTCSFLKKEKLTTTITTTTTTTTTTAFAVVTAAITTVDFRLNKLAIFKLV